MWIKICGIRDPATASAVAALNPDAIGLNFFARSARCLPVEAAAQIVNELPESVEPVGVFVDPEIDDFRRICAACGLRTVQLHGNESPERLRALTDALPHISIVRAFRLSESPPADDGAAEPGSGPPSDSHSADLGWVERYCRRCEELGIPLVACLVEGYTLGEFGGTGHPAPWAMLRERWGENRPPLILAGGLTPDNVAAAIHAVRPWGVDVASGVESARGVKDIARVARFIERARGTAAGDTASPPLTPHDS